MINLKNPFFDRKTRTAFLKLGYSSEQVRELFNMFNLEHFIKTAV
jgi:ABC-type transporter Mla MlaB component